MFTEVSIIFIENVIAYIDLPSSCPQNGVQIWDKSLFQDLWGVELFIFNLFV